MRPSMRNASTSVAPFSAPKPPASSNAADAGTGRSGSVTSMICNPSSPGAAVMAYVRPPAWNTSTSRASARAPNPPEPLNARDKRAGRSGPVISMICTLPWCGAPIRP